MQSQPASSNPTDFKRGRDNQPTAQPPINVTVTTPEPSPEAIKRQEDREERNVTAQEDIRDFTKALTFLAFAQGAFTLVAFVFTIRAANAAKSSADTASRSLELLNRPWPEIGKWEGRNQAGF